MDIKVKNSKLDIGVAKFFIQKDKIDKIFSNQEINSVNIHYEISIGEN